MQVFITGASGFVGATLCNWLMAGGWRVCALSRSDAAARRLPGGVEPIIGDPTQPGDWQEKAMACDAAINLAGASIFGRWNEKYKALIRSSRVRTTTNLCQAIAARPGGRDFSLVSASAVGYYGFSDDRILDEDSPPGNDFLATVCRDWETATEEATGSGARVVNARFGIVLGSGGGALGQMLPLFRWGLGGRLGSGKQWFSWIHQTDLTTALKLCLEDERLAGPVNCCAPGPVTNAGLTKALAKVLHRPAILPAPAFAVRLALGEFGSVLLEGQRVLPRRLEKARLAFRFPDVGPALADLL